MKPTKKEIELALKQLVEIKFLQEKDGKYKYHPNYKKVLITCKGKTKEEILLEALWKAGYFSKPKTEKEIKLVVKLLLLQK